MNRGTCIHFTGLGFGADYKECRCKAGVNYFETFDGRREGIMLRMPCVAFRELPAHRHGTVIKPGEATVRVEIDRKGHVAIPCAFRQEPTDEQVEEDRRQDAEWLEKAVAGIKALAARKVRSNPVKDRHDVVECPACKGRLHFYQSAHNGHGHAKCETSGCISLME